MQEHLRSMSNHCFSTFEPGKVFKNKADKELKDNGSGPLYQKEKNKSGKGIRVSGSRLEITVNRSSKVNRNHAREYIYTVCENKFRQLGFSAFSTFTTQLIIGTICEGPLYENFQSLLLFYSPLEIWMPECDKKLGLEFLLSQKEQYKNLICKLPILYFNETKGFNIIKLATKLDSNFNNDENYLVLASVFAMAVIFSPNYDIDLCEINFSLLEIKIYQPYDRLIINWEAIHELELIKSDNENNKKCILNLFKTRTTGGTRALKRLLIRPLAKKESIIAITESLKKLNNNKRRIHLLNQYLPQFINFEILAIRLLETPSSASENSLMRCYKLMTDITKSIILFIQFYEVLNNSKETDIIDSLFSYECYNKAVEILTLISKKIELDIPVKTDKHTLVNLIKNNTGVSVDLARHAYFRLYNQIIELFDNYRKKLTEAELGDLSMKVSSKFIHRLRLKKSPTFGKDSLSIEKVIEETILIKSENDFIINFTTPSFSTLSLRLDRCAEQILIETFQCLRNMITETQNFIPLLSYLSSEISNIDVSLALNEFSLKTLDFCVPSFLENCFSYMRIDKAQLMNKDLLSKELVSIFFYRPSIYHICCLESPERSLYIKNLVFFVILAQCGCFLPAKSAILPIFSRIFFKSSVNENHDTTLSSFTNEICNYKSVLSTIESKQTSLIILNNFLSFTCQQDIISLIRPLFDIVQNSSSCFLIIASDNPSLIPLCNKYSYEVIKIRYLSIVEEDENYKNIVTNCVKKFKFFSQNIEEHLKNITLDDNSYRNVFATHFKQMVKIYSDYMLQNTSKAEVLEEILKNENLIKNYK